MKPETMSSKTGPYAVKQIRGGKFPLVQVVGPTLGDGVWASQLTNEQLADQLNAAFLAGQESSRWIPVSEENQPERNSTVIYWHKSEFGEGFPEIAHEWRWEHHGDVATHFLSAPKALNT